MFPGRFIPTDQSSLSGPAPVKFWNATDAYLPGLHGAGLSLGPVLDLMEAPILLQWTVWPAGPSCAALGGRVKT